MFNLFSKNPPEVTELLNRISAAERRLPNELEAIGCPLLKQLADAVKRKWTTEHKRNYSAQIQDGELHEAFIYNFIVQTAADRLESGRLHIYRGVLGHEGHLYKQLFEHAIDTMIDIGGYTKEWADTNLRAPVYKGIKEAG